MPAFVRKILLVWLMVLPGPLLAQRQPAAPLPAVPNLSQLLRDSGYIFSGTVTGVKPIAPANSGAVATVEITFRVEEAIRGVQPGQTLVIHEWAGLWNSGNRYHAGGTAGSVSASLQPLGVDQPGRRPHGPLRG